MSQPKTRILIEEDQDGGCNISVHGVALDLTILLASAIGSSPTLKGIVITALILEGNNDEEE
jgi:hypothetical protein